MSRLCSLLVLLLLLAGAAADEQAELAPIRIQLQWAPQAQFAGFYVAQELGFFQDAGLDVTILESAGDILPAEAVANGDAEFGVTWAPKVLQANEAGADLVNIAQIFQRSGTVLVSFAEAEIESLTDLVHKTIGYWPGGNEFEIYAMTFAMGSDPFSGEHLRLVEQPFNLEPLLNGEVDAAQALIYNWYGRLLGTVNPATGELYREADLNVIDMNDIGVAMLQDHLIVRADWLAEEGNESITLGLLRATLRAWAHCRDRADDCVRILLEIDPSLGESHQRWQMNEVNKLIWPAPAGIGVLDEGLWRQTVEWMLELGALDAEPAEGAYRGDLVKQALELLEAEGLDMIGADWQPVEVIVRAGGQ